MTEQSTTTEDTIDPAGTDGAGAGRQPFETVAIDSDDRKLYQVAVDFGMSSATASMIDPWTPYSRVLGPASAAALARELAGLLDRDPSLARSGADGTSAPVPAAQLRSDAKEELAQADDRTEDRSEGEARSTRLRAACLALEQAAEYRPELAAHLHTAHGAAARALSLVSYQITPVLLEDERTAEVPSILSVPDPGNGGIGKAELQGWSEEGTTPFPALKRRLARPQRVELGGGLGGWEQDTDQLIAAAYADLVRRIGTFVANSAGARRGRGVHELVVTYPTVTPPVARARLRQLLRDALQVRVGDATAVPMRIDLRYDEGVAAALFFVMRELGSADDGYGVEVLRSRSRRVTDRSWERNLLVVDIGGGTTDIALITLELTDVTPEGGAGPVGPDGWRPRRYRLCPRVVGTSGHVQLGGDLLTLRVLYWIKAAIVDALGEPESEKLAPQVVGFGDPGPAPRKVRDSLRTKLPTHTPETAPADDRISSAEVLSAEFRLLWMAAEEAKKKLAQGESYPVPTSTLSKLSEKLMGNEETKETGEQLGEFNSNESIVLTPDDFRTLARPVLVAAMELAGELARRRLRAPDGAPGSAPPTLDAVALAGRTCAMACAADTAREVLSRVLSETRADGSAVAWDPRSLDVETTYAKQAASLGAVWAAFRTAETGAAAAAPHAQTGVGVADLPRTRVDVALGDLLLDLPAGFDIGHPTQQGVPIFDAGTRMDRCTPDGTMYVESAPMPVERQRRLLRRREGGSPIQWGRFDYLDARARQEQQAWADAPEHRSDPDRPLPTDVICRIRIDQQLTPTMLLRRGPVDRILVRPVQGPCPLPIGTAHDPTSMHLAVRLLGVPETEPVTLLEPGDFTVHAECQGEQTCRRAIVSAVALPRPAGRNDSPVEYQLLSGSPELWAELCEFTVGPAPAGGHWTVLDERSELWVTDGYPPYSEAATLHEMESTPGVVFSSVMGDQVPDLEPWWDPFNGTH